MHIHNANSSNSTGNPAGETLSMSQAKRRARWSRVALFVRCLFMAAALVAVPLSAQTFLPPTSSPNGFWNATPVVHFPSPGGLDLPSEAYLGLRMNGVAWYAIETGRGNYDWTGIDAYPYGNLLYTFLNAPAWASAVSPTSDNISGFSVSSGVITFTASNSLIATNKVPVTGLSTSCLNTTYSVLGDTHAPTSTTFSASVPSGCTPGSSSAGKYSFAGTSYQAPTDLSTSANCQGVLSGVYTTDCQYKEFVTAFMEHICPTSSTCKIRNFEGWNEFNGNGYWDDKYQHLATMMEDAARIVKAKCTNCQFGAGSVTAGGVGYNDSEVNSRSGSLNKHYTYYNDSLTALLDDWKVDVANDSTIPEPDFISWHPYSANYAVSLTQALSPQPMPEFVYSGNGLGAGGNTGSSVCTSSNESESTNKYCIDSVITQTSIISALTSTSAHGVQGKPFWATEGGFNALASMTNTDNNDESSANPKPICTGTYSPVCTADVLRSAYLARWLINLKAGGVARAYWYSWDEPCFGTLFGMDAAKSGNSIPCSKSYNPNGATLYTLYDTKTRAGNSWDQVEFWLNGASIPSNCVRDNTSHFYTCTITRNDPAGYVGLMVWYTSWLGTQSYTPPAGYTQYRKLDNPTPVPYFSGSVTVGAEPILFEKKN